MFCSASRFAFAAFRETVASKAKERPFSFFSGEEEDSTYEASPLPLPSPL